jgi:RND family efflux transporter MFP subunit
MPREIAETYTTTGTLITDDRVEIASRIMGYIRSITVKEGDKIRKGQLLLTIDPTEIQARLEEAEARLAQANARSKEAKADLQRYKQLFEQRLVAATQFRKVELAYEVAEQEQRAAEAALSRVRVEMQYAEIRSPVDGVVVQKQRQKGDIATPGAALLTVENPENIVMRTFIREDHLENIKVGDPVRITVDAARLQTDGIVTQVVTAGDPATHSYMVKAALKDSRGARTGMFARAEFSIGRKWGITVPREAIVMRADLPGTYVVDDQGRAHFRMLRTGRELDGDMEILAGLNGGERIALHSDVPLHSGDLVLERQDAATSMPQDATP